MLFNLRSASDDSTRRSRSRSLFGGIALVALALTVAACGSGATKTTAATTTTPTTATGGPGGAGRAAALQPFIQCMKTHGVTVTGGGFRGGGGAPTDGTGGTAPATTLPPGVTQQQYDAALAACRSLIPARQTNPATAAYRNCVNLQLQQHGVTTLPQGGGGFGGGGFGGGGNGGSTATTNPALPAAMQACAALRPVPGTTTTTKPATSA